MVPFSPLCRFLVIAVSVAFPTSAYSENCKPLTEIASLPIVSDIQGGISIAATIENHQKTLILDTGGMYNLLKSSAINDIGLNRVAVNPALYLMLFDGKPIEHVAIAHSFQLGNITADKIEFLEIPENRLPSSIAGTLGPSTFAAYDVEVDPTGHKLNFFSRDHCAGQVIYWTHEPVAVIPMRLDSDLHIRISVTLDGQSMDALIDTGTTGSILAGYAAPSNQGNAQSDVSTEGALYRRRAAAFKALTIDGVQISNPDIDIEDNESIASDLPPLTLGMGVLSHLRFFIAYREGYIYATAPDAH